MLIPSRLQIATADDERFRVEGHFFIDYSLPLSSRTRGGVGRLLAVGLNRRPAPARTLTLL
jgi:hypothetical protein